MKYFLTILFTLCTLQCMAIDPFNDYTFTRQDFLITDDGIAICIPKWGLIIVDSITYIGKSKYKITSSQVNQIEKDPVENILHRNKIK